MMRPRTRPVDPSAVLGVAPGASRADIRRAYRQLALAMHPDVAGHEATAEMAQLNTARDDLLARHAARETDPHPRAGAPTPPRRSADRPSPRTDHEPVWADHWSAWNDLPKRTEPPGT